MRIIKLIGVINNHLKNEEVMKRLIDAGAFTTSIMSREIAIELPLEKLEDIKDVVKRLDISELKIRDLRRIETTVTQAGCGRDPEDVVKIYLAPAARVIGHKLMRINIDEKVKKSIDENIEELSNIYSNFVKYVLTRCGVSDVVYSIDVKKKREDMENALELATIDAIHNSNGLIQIN